MFSRIAVKIACVLVASACVTAPLPSHAQKPSQSPGGQAEAEQILDTIVEKVWALTDLHWHKGEYCHIVNICKISAAADPTNVDAYGNGAWLLWSMDRDAEAIEVYKQGLKANPKSYYMYDEIGYYYYNRKKDYPLAIEYLGKASQMPDCKLSTIHTLAHAYEKSGNLQMSAKTWERAAKDPNDTAAKLNLDRVRRKMKKQ